MVYLKQYILNVLIGLDQLLFALIGGDPDETWSSAAWRLYINTGVEWPYKLIDKIFYPNHCKDSYEPREGSRSLWASRE